jgi:hypothetical protein
MSYEEEDTCLASTIGGRDALYGSGGGLKRFL